MEQIKILVNGKVETLLIRYKCPQYIFCECEGNFAARGFYTTAFVQANKQ